jgi:hypothetical protein
MIKIVFSYWVQMRLWLGFGAFLGFLALFFATFVYLACSGSKENDTQELRQYAEWGREKVG